MEIPLMNIAKNIEVFAVLIIIINFFIVLLI